MKIIESDLEYVRDPVGFPVDVANSVPAILMADYLKLDSIAFGTIMEASYGVGHKNIEIILMAITTPMLGECLLQQEYRLTSL